MGLFSAANLYGMTIRESANDGSDFTNPDADYRRLFLGEDGQLHVKDSAGAVTDIGGAVTEITDIPTADTTTTNVLAPDGAGGVEWRAEAGGLTSSINQLSGDVTMTTANTFYDGPSLTLGAGTYLLVGTVTFFDNSGSGGQEATAKLWNGTAVADSQQNTVAASYHKGFTLTGLVTLAGSETWKISVAADTNTNLIKAAATANGAGNNASTLIAVKIA